MSGPVAIVGMAFRLPGAADEESLWSLLAQRRTALSPVPVERWDSAKFHDRSHATPNKTVMARGGFLAHMDRFDAAFFGISGREARAMDPQQRMLLEETWRCLENAGVRPSDLEGRRVGVFAGIMATDYQQNAAAPGQPISGFSALGTYGALLANRLSHAFQWTGPSVTVDAACASSLVAVHQACRALSSGECDYAIVAAANALINPWRSISFSQAHMLSPDGECRTFDAGANGYVQGEGAVVMLLTRRDLVGPAGLRERAAILGSAINHVGPSRSVTAPSVDSQVAVIEAAIADAGIDRESIGYVEAHGTGTPLGDPIEAAALSAVFVGTSPDKRAIGSIKSNIGHLEAAAGLAGLAKLVLMLERGTLLPTALLDQVNPLIDLEAGRVAPVMQAMPWPKDRPRAGISSFGFGGANSHVVVEGPAPDRTPVRKTTRRKPAMPYLLSAASEAALSRLRAAHLEMAQAAVAPDLGDVTQTLARRRKALPVRFAAVVKDWKGAAEALAHSPVPPLPGRWMLRVGAIDGLEAGTWDRLVRELPDLAERGEAAVEAARRDGARRAPRLLQLARLHALTGFLIDAGLVPDVLYGEGVGRWAAMTAAGVLDLADAVAATGEGKRPDVMPRRPRIAVYDPVLEGVIPPRRIDADYVAGLAGDLEAGLSALPELMVQAERLLKSNRTFRGFLDGWRDPLAALGIGTPESWTGVPSDGRAAKALLLALATARRQTCQRWNIPEPGVVLTGGADEATSLVALGALSPADAVLLLDAATVGSVAARIDPGLLTPEAVSGRLPALAAAWSRISEIGDPRAWLQGRAGRPRKPDPLGIDRTVDLGSLATLAEGEATVLSVGGGFADALLHVLTERWVSGDDVDWSTFARPHRIADLPPYPFEPDRHWLPLAEVETPASPKQTAPGPDPAPIYDLAWSPIAPGPAASGPVILLSGDGALGDSLPAATRMTVGPADASVAETLLAGPLAGTEQVTVVVAWPFETVGLSAEDSETRLVLPVLRLAAGLAEGPGRVRLVLVGCDLAERDDDPVLDPGFAAALAAAQSVAAENRVSLETGGVLVAEGGGGLEAALGVSPIPGFGVIAARDDRLLVRHLVPAPDRGSTAASDDRAWLLIGGFGGIGEALIRHLARQQGRRIAVIGRRALEDVAEIRARLSDAGISTAYAAADATDAVSLAGAVAALEAEVGQIGTVVHGEMVLSDRSAAGMSDTEFHTAFAPKAIGFAAVSTVFSDRGKDRPRRVVFGSVLGLTGNAGQANYAAGTAHQMAQALLAAREGWDVRHISWGYWAEAGRVANARHKARVARIGLEPMSTGAGLAALARVLAGDPRPVVVAELSAARLADLSGQSEQGATAGLSAVDDLAMLRIRAAFTGAGWLAAPDGGRSAIATGQERLFDTLTGFLAARGWTAPDPTAAARADALAAEIRATRPALSGVVDLLEAAGAGTVPVLTGEIPGTGVIFPGGEMTLVEGYYQGNPLADAANARVAERVAEQVNEGLAEGRALRILEVGAGTGGTTAPVLDALDAVIGAGSVEYVFSDLSPAFLRRAKRRFGAERPWFGTARFDFDADPAEFADLGSFDLVIAANALHVTETVDTMLGRLAARIAPGGTLILNELMRPLEHMTAIFGLLPGWWFARDARAGAGPLLAPEQWRAALDSRFADIEIDGPGDAHGVLQGILVASFTGGQSQTSASADPTRIYALIAECLEVDPARLDPDALLEDLGLDSILTFDLAERISAEAGVTLDPATITDLATPAALAAEVLAQGGAVQVLAESPQTTAMPAEPAAAPAPVAASEPMPDEAIAIIGASGTFPGADSLAALETLILDGAPALGPVPEGRWSEADIALAGAEGLRGLRGAFLNHGEDFDAARFGISDREAQVIDPRQRLLLEQSLAALADAGRPDLGDAREAFGVFTGTGGGDYAQKLMTAGHPVQPQSLGALLPSSSAARIAHAFGFEGPAMAVDLACASGLAALHLAVGALRRGECRVALVGAASLQATPGFAVQVDRAGLLSRSGNPMPFQTESDGIVLGEGAVVLVLKPLRQALADGDRVRAVVRGTGLTQSGGGDALTSPSARAQARVMTAALGDAGLAPSEIRAVEAHGVGTRAGDETEAAALATLFPAGGAPVAVDTVKPVLGHGLEVSGLSALAVAMLGLRREAGLPRLPSRAQFPGTALAPDAPRRSGPVLINGFSMNGACAAAVIAPAPTQAVAPTTGPVEIVLSAALRADLEDRLHGLKAWMLDQRPEPGEVAAILTGDPPRRCRAVLRGATIEELLAAIDAALAGRLSETTADGATAARMTPPARPLGYPFARRRYWPDGAVAVPVALKSAEPAPTDGAPLAVVASCLGVETARLDTGAVARELGVDSIMALEIRARLAARALLAVDIADLLGDRPLSEVLQAARPLGEMAVLVPDPANAEAPFPLTDLQLAYLVGRSPSVPLGGTGCHVYWEFLCERPVDTSRLEQAWNRLVETHGMLRAVFTEEGEQRVLAAVPPVSIPHRDWRDLPAPGADAALEEMRGRMAHEVFDPATWPLFRIETSDGPAGARIHFSIDLLIIDVLSLFGLLRQWGRLYRDPQAEPAAPGVSFRDYMAAFARLRDGDERARALGFWQAAMAEAPGGPALPRARADAELSGARFTRRRTELSADAWSRFRERARKAGATPVSALVAALGATLGRWSETPDFCLNLTVYDRRSVHPDIDKVVGDFTSTILLPTGADHTSGFAAAAASLSSAVAQRLDHTLVSGSEAVRRFGGDGAAGALSYVFTSMLGYDAVIGHESRITDLGRLDWGVTQTPQVLLDVQAFEEDGRLVATWDSVDAAYPDGLFESAFAAFAATLSTLAAPEADWNASATTAIERRERELVASVNATEGPVSDDLLHEPLLRRALAEPQRLAILAPEESWSYGGLAGRALAVAARLPDMPADTLVGVALEKSPWQIAAALGVLIAGGAYLPLDPSLPAERFRSLARKGAVGVVLTTRALAGQLAVPEGVEVLAVDGLEPAPLPDGLPPRRRSPDDLAYVLFTSGSTGEPKGVMIEHRAALNTVLDCNARFGVTAADRVFGLSALGFDLSVYDIFGPPALGAALVLPAPDTLRDPDALAERAEARGVTVWNSVPMLLNMVLESAPRPESLASLRLAMLSGDWIPLSLPPLLRALAPQAELVSLGGATEASIWSICHPVGELSPDWRSVPYGRPMRNQGFHILDADLAPCAEGVEGDLYISGVGLARGYWRDPVRTAEAFLTHPTTGQRLYRTGDRGRWRAGGVIEFLGRRDGQVKIGGFRIELGEVEAAALRHPDIRLAVALAEGNGSDGRRRLILHAVPDAGRQVNPDILRAHLAELLPGYMVPRAIRIEAALPLTENGKVDRKALAALSVGQAEEPEAAAPDGLSTGELIGRISAIVAEVVGLESVSPEASFFDLGADSMSAVLINRQLRGVLGLRTRITDLFEHPSVALLAAHLSAAGRSRIVVGNDINIDLQEFDKKEIIPNSLDEEPASLGARRAGMRRAFRDRFAASRAVPRR